MGYAVIYKDASLTQIFTLSARRYTEDCFDAVAALLEKEAPESRAARISRRPTAWVLRGELTDELKQKLLALPFVARVETNDEMRARFKRPKPVSAKIRGWIQDRIYR